MHEEDYILKSIRLIIRTLARILFGTDKIDYKLSDEKMPIDYLHLDLLSLINEGRINEAENLLFKNIDVTNIQYMKLGLDFYNRLNDLDENILKEYEFSKEEIKDGLIDLSETYGLNIWRE